MRFEYGQARSGERTIRIDGRFLHSRYDPRREAQRFVQSLAPEFPAGVSILIGDGTGVVREELRNRFPEMHALSVEPLPGGETVITGDPDLHDTSREHPDRDTVSCSVEAPETLSPGTIRSRMHPLHLASLQIVTWTGAQTAIPRWTETVEATVLSALRDLKSELATIGTFGRTWLANALRRTLTLDERIAVAFSGDGLVVAAAGPRLRALERLVPREKRARVPIVAASSALSWLNDRGFKTDLAVHTDGGFWARRYMGDTGACTTGIALPLRAATGRLSRANLFRTGWFGEELAPDRDEWIPQEDQPTVGASLVQIAHHLRPDGHLLLCGLDLCTLGLAGHASPHRNDRYIRNGTSRLETEETIRSRRAGHLTGARILRDGGEIPAWQTPSLESYREPLATLIEQHTRTGTLSFLEPSPVWADMTCPTGPVPTGHFSRAVLQRPGRSTRREHARRVLKRWREQIEETPEPPALTVAGMDLLLHLAPVEAVQWLRSGDSKDALRGELRRATARLLRIVEHYR
ncbi:MAG: hypothetical protein EA427_08320 [Spirochaetaceae bacterium]|nr:MAG: hypothetical protein EA427_08320 [Spirochaetaceae bacterium]